jgi:hypothetical protein
VLLPESQKRATAQTGDSGNSGEDKSYYHKKQGVKPASVFQPIFLGFFAPPGLPWMAGFLHP